MIDYINNPEIGDILCYRFSKDQLLTYIIWGIECANPNCYRDSPDDIINIKPWRDNNDLDLWVKIKRSDYSKKCFLLYRQGLSFVDLL